MSSNNGVAPATNGKAAQPKTAAAVTANTTTAVVKVIKPETENLPPIEDRLHKLNMLYDLQRRHGKLVDTKQKLIDFGSCQNRENSKLTIEDDDDNEFSTSNPAVIDAVKELIITTVTGKIAELEKQIVF